MNEETLLAEGFLHAFAKCGEDYFASIFLALAR